MELGVGAGAGAIVTSSGIEDGGVYTSHGIGIHVSIDENDQLTSSYEGESSRTLLKDLTACVDKAVHWSQITRDKSQRGRYSRLSSLDDLRRFLSSFSVVVPSAIKGERLARGESFWSGKMNEVVIADHLSLVDDGLMEGGMSSGSRDDEGVPSRTQTIVEFRKINWRVMVNKRCCKTRIRR